MTDAQDSQVFARIADLAVLVQQGIYALDEARAELRVKTATVTPATLWHLHDPAVVQSVPIGTFYPDGNQWYTLADPEGRWENAADLVAYLRELDSYIGTFVTVFPAWVVNQDGTVIRLPGHMADFIEGCRTWESTPGPGASTRARPSPSAGPA